jgi:hypothetical protein
MADMKGERNMTNIHNYIERPVNAALQRARTARISAALEDIHKRRRAQQAWDWLCTVTAQRPPERPQPNGPTGEILWSGTYAQAIERYGKRLPHIWYSDYNV